MRKSIRFLGWIGILLVLVGLGVYALNLQYMQGFASTGMRDVMIWGVYITNFEFLVGISTGIMIAISAAYLWNNKLFEPILHIGGILATVTVVPAMLFVAADIGRPERLLNIALYPNMSSMLIFDFIALSAYIVFCLVFCLVTITGKGGKKAKSLVAAIGLPFAVLAHSFTAWVFGVIMARPLWHSSLLAPIFLSSALVSGVSLLIFTAFLISRFGGLKFSSELTSELARFLGAIILVDAFFIFVELVTVGYRAEFGFLEPLSQVLTGPYVTVIWIELAIPLVVFALLAYPKTRKSTAILTVVALIAMRGIWVKRYSMLTSGLAVSPLGEVGNYSPTMTEWAVTVSLYALGALLFSLGLKLLPFLAPKGALLLGSQLAPKPKSMITVQDKESTQPIKDKPNVSRRDFLRLTAGVAAGAAALASIPGSSILLSKQEANTQASTIKEWAMVVDLRRCIGCQACFAACKSENGVPMGIQYTWVETHEEGKYPNMKLTFLPRLCNHCDNPPCTQVCPVNATYKREQDGIVMQDVNRCIGCRYCMAACPYEVRSFLWEEPKGAWPQAWNGKADAKHGFVVKCHGCFHRIEKGLKPACVDACVGGARIFGDIQDPNSAVRKVVDAIPTSGLKAYLGAKPMVFYVGLSDKIAERGKKAANTIVVHQEE